MKKCSKCNVTVNTNYKTCPLCYNELTETKGEVNELFKQRELEPKKPSVKKVLKKLFLFLSIIAIIVCVTINLMVKVFPLWSLLVVLGILYVWILIVHTIISKRNIFEKLFLQIGTIIGLLFACQWISDGRQWMVDYVIPCISMAVMLVLFILCLRLKNHQGLVSFFIMNIILTLLSGILLICKVPDFSLLNIITCIIGCVSFLGVILFSGSALKTEFGKKFHV